MKRRKRGQTQTDRERERDWKDRERRQHRFCCLSNAERVGDCLAHTISRLSPSFAHTISLRSFSLHCAISLDMPSRFAILFLAIAFGRAVCISRVLCYSCTLSHVMHSFVRSGGRRDAEAAGQARREGPSSPTTIASLYSDSGIP